MTKEDYINAYTLANKNVARYSNEQMARKVLLNSLYGAQCNRFFRFYNLEIGKSITLTGQVFIKYSEHKLNEFINKEVGTENCDYCRLIDTDSVRGDSIINVDGDNIKIAPCFNRCSQNMKCDNFNQQYVKIGEGKTLGYNGENIVLKSIKYVMKHHAKKKMYKIKGERIYSLFY